MCMAKQHTETREIASPNLSPVYPFFFICTLILLSARKGRHSSQDNNPPKYDRYSTRETDAPHA